MITGMIRPTSGSIEFDGHRWSRKDLARIGALIEAPPLYDNLKNRKRVEGGAGKSSGYQWLLLYGD